ncbi:MAG: glycosyltransferase family 2 protein [Candidatus Pacebacteria bacterium CG10_big_fil_rev_8_21_14_0_10_44_54]|nr:glycosyltransferase family 2 protein [Candidatus Paceibacterota bacterium]PIR60804.1 MAG: glycosyltransferase family 2 protein [Candidatus Pacebacteria bacterium CG10_big_fil_rev_8_21_14_0_10_44_54]
MKLSIVVTTKNAARTLERTLKSVRFADEIVVVDMMSSDETQLIARRFTDKVFTTADVGYVEPARNFSLSKAKGEWVLVVDADEVVSATLRDQILQVIELDSNVVCYAIARKNILFGKWVQTAGWWPDFQPRLFQRGCVEWSDAIHSKPKVTGESVHFPADEALAFEHYNYESISEFVSRMDLYTTIAAQNKVGRDTIVEGPVDVFRREMLQRLFPLRGIDGGYRGLLLAFLQGFSEVVQAAKFWQLQRSEEIETKPETLLALAELRAQLAYWIADEQMRNSNGIAALTWRFRRKLRL